MTQENDVNKLTHFIPSENSNNKKDEKLYKKTELYNWVKTRNNLPFSSSWISNINPPIKKISKSFNLGIESGLIQAYPPLYDIENSVVAQFEHTCHIGERTTEIFSLGNDY